MAPSGCISATATSTGASWSRTLSSWVNVMATSGSDEDDENSEADPDHEAPLEHPS